MISRIRIEAFGRTPNEVADTLYPHADRIEKLLGVSVSRGECVIERQVNEPDNSLFAFSGRLNLHPDISERPTSITVTDGSTGMNWSTTSNAAATA